MSKSKAGIPIAIIVIIILVLLYLITAGKANFFETEEEKREEKKRKLEERMHILNIQTQRVEKILVQKIQLRDKLNRICKIVFFSVRLLLVCIFFTVFIASKLQFGLSINDLLTYISFSALIIAILGFLIIGSPTECMSIWNYLKKKLTLYIYGKYMNIEQDIKHHELDITTIGNEKDMIKQEIENLTNFENELHEIMTENPLPIGEDSKYLNG